MFRTLSILALALACLSLHACHGEPEQNCSRVRFGWPYFQLDPSSDVSPNEGLQIDFSVRSDLLPGGTGRLSVAASGPEGDEDRAFAASAVADEDGLLTFSEITIPFGEIVFSLDAKDECGSAGSGKRTYVWDGEGTPQCQLSLASGFAVDPETEELLLRSEHDEDADSAGMQVTALVDMGRPDMQVSLFVLDRETSEQQNFEFEAGSDGVGQQSLTLADGEQALRAVCYWQPEEFRVNTPTRVYQVDSESE